MAALCRLLLIVLLAFAVGPGARAQGSAPVENPAEHKAYVAATSTRDAIKRAQALEVFIAWYPNSTLRIDAYEQLMAAWQSANTPAKADAAAVKLLQIDPDNVRALANRAYVGRARAAAGDASALAPAIAAAERGLVALAKWPKPESVSDSEFVRLKLQFMAIFDGVIGHGALQAKDYPKARKYYREAVAVDPDNLQDVYQFSVALLEGVPLDALGFWYAARAMAIARTGKSEPAAAGIEKYARARYRQYHGSDEGWDKLVARTAGERQPPDKFASSISRMMTPQERAIQLVTDNDPGALSYPDWELVLGHRDASAANKLAAERVWKAIRDKQRGGEARLKIPFRVVSATSDRIKGAITDENQASNTVDLDIALARPLSPLPAVGAQISIVGTLREYRAQPFLFIMTDAELAQESLPVAGGTCADPRPQMCTLEYRPACGLRRDGSRKTYSNACSACGDAEVVSQSAGACPER